MSPFFKCRVFNNKIHFRRQGTSWCDIFDDWITFCCLACLSNLIYACPSSSMPACAWCQLLSSDLHTIFSVFACKAKCAVGTRPLGLFYTFQLSKNIWRCVPNPWVLLGFRSADPKLINPGGDEMWPKHCTSTTFLHIGLPASYGGPLRRSSKSFPAQATKTRCLSQCWEGIGKKHQKRLQI